VRHEAFAHYAVLMGATSAVIFFAIPTRDSFLTSTSANRCFAKLILLKLYLASIHHAQIRPWSSADISIRRWYVCASLCSNSLSETRLSYLAWLQIAGTFVAIAGSCVALAFSKPEVHVACSAASFARGFTFACASHNPDGRSGRVALHASS